MQKPVTSNIPHGVGCPPPPGMDPRKGKGKLMCIKVRMLNDTVGVFHLGHKATGQALFDEVCRYLNLLESDYFGLEFIDSYGNRCWLDKEKSILRQIMVAQSDARFFFVVKFYTPNPAELEEEYTRYLFALQIHRDLFRGELICSNENTTALLVALIIQAECGDFSPQDYPNADVYLAGLHFVPHQTPTFAKAVMEQHQRMIGMEPPEADFILLETARRCDFYGLRLHPARDIEGTEVALAVAHMGIKVFHQMNCVTTFSWAKVRKLSFKRKRMMIKVHPDSFQFYKETIEFSFENRDDCKNFWKKCVEHHSFFRCAEPIVGSAKGTEDNGIGGRKGTQQQHHHQHNLFTRGSNFQYRGRTQKQLIDYVREHRKRREPFQRPLRRGNAAVFSGGGRGGGATFGTNSLGRAQFLVSDRTNIEKTGGMSNGQQQTQQIRADEANNFVCTFPSLCSQQQQNGGGSKGRPKSAVITNEKRGQKDSNKAQQQQQRQQLIMQNSYHAGMGGQQQKEFRNERASTEAQNSLMSAEAMALLHLHMDPMCMSMPNVLSTDSFLGPSLSAAPSAAATGDASSPRASFLHNAHKSVSGENFHYAAELREDNQSEGSYRVGWLRPHRRAASQKDDTAASSAASSQSDIISAGAHSPVDPRVYQTTFTTKRVGNVIMKRVMNSNGTANDASAQPTNAASAKSHRQYPLTRRSAVDGDESDSLASSSVAFSDYSLSTTGPPASSFPGPTTTVSSASCATASATAASRATTDAGRTRCIAPPTVAQPQQQRQHYQQLINNSSTCQVLLPVHLRNEVPVPIDGPPPVNIVSRPGQHQHMAVGSVTPMTIIRPVLLPSPASALATNLLDKGCANLSTNSNGIGNGSVRPFSSSTASSTSTPTQSTTAQRRPIVVAAKASPSPPPPLLNIKAARDKHKQTKQKENDEKRREQEFLDKEKVALNGPPTMFSAGGGEKPKVPPKPDINALRGTGQNQPKGKEEVNPNLAGPLESILKDVRSMNEALDVLESPTSGTPRSVSSQRVGAVTTPAEEDHQQQVSSAIISATSVPSRRRRLPDAISVESDDCPSVRTVHLFNDGDNRVPYTLTVRDLSGGGQQQQKATTSDGSSDGRQWYGDSATIVSTSSSTSGGAGGRSRTATALEGPMALGGGGGGGVPRHKSLELVHRKRLPPQGAFSSQDHSIAATSPEAGNVLEYVVSQRQRSASSERSSSSGITEQQNANKQTADRGHTQRVEIVGKGTEKKSDEEREESQNWAEEERKNEDKVPTEAGEGHNSQIGDNSPPQRQPQKLLETDF